jgi:uncharacterized membrane protein (DUF485 family)
VRWVRRSSSRRLIFAWVVGLIGGAEALVITIFVFPLGIALVVLTAFIRPRPAALAGASVAWGAGFIVAMKQAADRCAEINRQPNASCTMGDNTPFAAVGIAVFVVGVLLTIYVLGRARKTLSVAQ